MNTTLEIGSIPTNSNLLQTSSRDEFPEYGIKTENVFFNNIPTKYQAITKHGKFVTIMTKSYYVMPNGQIKKTMENILPKVGAKPYVPANTKYGWHESGDKDGAIYNSSLQTQMTLSYLFPEKFDITGAGDFVETGFSVINSEDGTFGLTVSPFVLRNSCDNRMFHLAHEKIVGYETGKTVQRNDLLVQGQQNVTLARAELDTLSLSRRHSKSLNLDYIVDVVANIKTFSQKVIDRYQQMYQLKVNQATAEALAKAMPKRVLDDCKWIDVAAKTGKVTVKDVTQWDAFNDITKSLTYGKSVLSATLSTYKQLDRILVTV